MIALEIGKSTSLKTGIQKFLKKCIESGAIDRQEGSGRKSTITAKVRRLV